MSSAPDSVQAFTFGSFSLLGIHLRARLLLPWWLVGTAARELASHFSFFLFLWSLSHSGVYGQGAGRGLPIGLFLFQLWGCPASALAVAGFGGRVLRAHPFVGTVDWCLLETSLPLLHSPVSLRCSGCACLGLRPCGKCLRLCLRKVP